MNKYEIVNEYDNNDYEYLSKVIDKTLEYEMVDNAIFSVILVGDKEIRELNKKYRSIDKETDVLSFAYEDNLNIKVDIRVLGEVFVCIPVMERQAKEYGHSTVRELSFLVVHGILHLLGYDHTLGKKEEEEMFFRQEVILNEFEETKKA